MKRPEIEEIKKGWEQCEIKPLKEETLELIEYIEYLEAQDIKRNWPQTLYEQYLVALDERDTLQEELDKSLETINELLKRDLGITKGRLIFGNDCDHDFQEIIYGAEGRQLECIKCGEVPK